MLKLPHYHATGCWQLSGLYTSTFQRINYSLLPSYSKPSFLPCWSKHVSKSWWDEYSEFFSLGPNNIPHPWSESWSQHLQSSWAAPSHNKIWVTEGVSMVESQPQGPCHWTRAIICLCCLAGSKLSMSRITFSPVWIYKIYIYINLRYTWKKVLFLWLQTDPHTSPGDPYAPSAYLGFLDLSKIGFWLPTTWISWGFWGQSLKYKIQSLIQRDKIFF